MNNRERVIASLRHQQPDKTPYQFGFTVKAHEKMAAYLGDRNFQATLGNALSLHGAGPVGEWREVEPGIVEDPFGVRWDRRVDKDIGVVINQLVTPDNYRDYRFPAARDVAHLKEKRVTGDEFLVADLGFSLFERAWTLAGMETILMGMVAEPDFVHGLLDRILEFNLSVIEKVCAVEEVDAMMFGDDWGQQTGLIMGPAHWREFIKPRVAQMYGRLKKAGKFVFIHSCGKVDAIFPDLIEIGLDCFNPFQPEVIDVDEAKRRYGGSLTFYGGISTQRTLPFGTPADVRREVKHLLEVVGRNGGLIAAPAHAMPGDVKPENVMAMIEVLQGQ